MIKTFAFLIQMLLLAARTSGQVEVRQSSGSMRLEDLIAEAVRNNPAIRASHAEVNVMLARAKGAGSLDDPELKFMQEGMPNFRPSEAMFSRIELMQMVPFPGKLGTEQDLARIRARSAEATRHETLNEVVAALKSALTELWLVQRNIALERENSRLMQQYLEAARTKYTNGQGAQQDVLKAQVELAMIGNGLIALRQKELSVKAMLGALLNREAGDTLGVAEMPEGEVSVPQLDSLLEAAARRRPMLLQDSLMIDENIAMRSMARQGYLPDFRFALEHMTEPMGSFTGWSVSAGITIPFAPWTLGKASARVEEAQAALDRSSARYASSRSMVSGRIRDLYYRAESAKRRLDALGGTIIQQARQSASADLTAYRNGSADFLMLIDSYRTVVSLSKEYYMTRMEFVQVMAEIDRETGSDPSPSIQ